MPSRHPLVAAAATLALTAAIASPASAGTLTAGSDSVQYRAGSGEVNVIGIGVDASRNEITITDTAGQMSASGRCRVLTPDTARCRVGNAARLKRYSFDLGDMDDQFRVPSQLRYGSVRVNAGPGKDSLFGARGRDLLAGGAGPDLIVGLAGNDSLNGGAGKDEIDGGPGNDRLTGGAGVDDIAAGRGRDTIFTGTGKSSSSGSKDDVTCGSGRDRVYMDRNDEADSTCERKVRARR